MSELASLFIILCNTFFVLFFNNFLSPVFLFTIFLFSKLFLNTPNDDLICPCNALFNLYFQLMPLVYFSVFLFGVLFLT